MKTATAPADSPDEPSSRTEGVRHRWRNARRPVIGGVVALSIAVGIGLVVIGSPGGVPEPDASSAPAAAAGPPAPSTRPAHEPDTGGPQPGRTPGRDTEGIGASGGVLHRQLPGLGPKTLARIPAKSRQVVIATGRGAGSPRSAVTLWTRTEDDRWGAGETWQAHNGLRGWSRHHRLGDLRSPVGVFSLSDAGGLRPDPGTRLPYHQSPDFAIHGTGFRGEPLEGTFDHVVAIDYNRVPGNSPLDKAKPMGPDRGGGIWLHVDHAGPTQGCVTLAEEDLIALMRTLDPAARPVIVMGDRISLER